MLPFYMKQINLQVRFSNFEIVKHQPPPPVYTGCPKNSGLTVHYGVEETTVNVRKMFKKFYWTYLLIGRSLKVALNRKIILKYMY
jgi:hypothetical protein